MSEKGLRLAGDTVIDLRLVGRYYFFFNTFCRNKKMIKKINASRLDGLEGEKFIEKKYSPSPKEAKRYVPARTYAHAPHVCNINISKAKTSSNPFDLCLDG